MKEADESATAASSGDFMSSFLSRYQPPTDSINYFRSTWMDRYLSSPLYQPIATFSRHLKETGEDYFFARTVNTPTTIPHLVSLKLKDFRTPAPVKDLRELEGDPTLPRHKRITVVPDAPDAVMLLQLGSPGVDGHPNTLHGGLISAILDETMGLLVMLHDDNVRHTGHRNSLYTGNLNVSFRGPIPTPSLLLVKTWLVGRSGRKWLSKGQLCNEQDQVLAEAEGIWITVKGHL